MSLLSDWFKFRVQTLDKPRFEEASQRLAAIAGPFRPDLLIGIRSGGYVVAQAMAVRFPDITLLPITCRRPSTHKKQKSSVLKRLLLTLPGGITDRLRIIEHMLLTQRRPARQSPLIANEDELAAIENDLRGRGPSPRILVVDDAVDSGATLASVVGMLRRIAGPDAAIKTAAITVTTASPFIEPNFMLYRYVLCRFPWSLDFKN